MTNKYKLNIYPFVISFMLACISFLSDNIFFKKEYIDSEKYITYKIIYFLLIIIIGQLIYRLITILPQNLNLKKTLLFAVMCVVILTFFLILLYPGIWGWDNMEMLNLASTMNMSGWHGFYMQCFFVFSLMLIPLPVGIVIVQIIIIATIMSRIYYILLSDLHYKKAAMLLLIFLILPGNLYRILLPYRTAFFGFLCSLAIIEFIHFWHKKNTNIYYLMLLYGFIWNIRSEGFVLLLFVPIIAYKIFKYINAKKAILFLCGSFIVVKIVSLPLPHDRIYIASAFMNPLQCMMKCELYSDNLQRDLLNINKVFNVEILQKSDASALAANMEGSAWTQDEFWDNIYCSEEDWQNMIKSYCNLVYFNPLLFLKFRLHTLYESLKVSGIAIGEINAIISDAAGQFNFATFNGSKPFSEGLRQITAKILRLDFGNTLPSIGNILGNSIIPIIILFLLLFYSIFRKRGDLLLVCIVITMLISIVFITAPASNPMYYFSLYNSMYMLLFIYVIKSYDNFKMKRSNKRKTNSQAMLRKIG